MKVQSLQQTLETENTVLTFDLIIRFLEESDSTKTIPRVNKYNE